MVLSLFLLGCSITLLLLTRCYTEALRIRCSWCLNGRGIGKVRSYKDQVVAATPCVVKTSYKRPPAPGAGKLVGHELMISELLLAKPLQDWVSWYLWTGLPFG